MNKFINLSQKSKKIVTTIALAVVAFVFAISSLMLLKVNAEPLSSAVVNENASITPPTNGGYYGIAHYEFKDATNLGKDSLGNFDLAVGSKVVKDDVNGGIVLASDNAGLLYAPKLSTGNDFSNLVEESFSVSTRVYIAAATGGGNNLFSTASQTGGFKLDLSSNGFVVPMLGENISIGKNEDVVKGDLAWYRITMIYENYDIPQIIDGTSYAGQFRMTVYNESLASEEDYEPFAYTKNLTSTLKFYPAASSAYSFTIGGRANTTGGSGGDWASFTSKSTGQGVAPSMSDLRIYSGVIDQAEIDAIAAYDAANADSEVDDNPTTLGMAKTLLANNSEVLGAALRLSENTGLRFMATLKESVVNEYVATYGEENVEFGVKIIRNHNGQKSHVYVAAINNEVKDGTYSFNAVITDLTEDYYSTEFTAQVYVSYTVEDKTTYVVAELPLSELTRSVTQVAELAIADIYTVGVDGTLEEKPEKYAYEIETGVYSAYSTTALETLNAFIVE